MQLCRPKRRCTLARLGAIDLRAQTHIPSVLRADTPEYQKHDWSIRSMCPQQIGGIALRAAVVGTEARCRIGFSCDLLRRSMYLVHKRAEVVAHLVNINSQYNPPPFG
jgi:hypothetical protein